MKASFKNKTQHLICCLFLLISTTVLSQGWERVFGGTSFELGYSVVQTPNGDFIGAGFTTSFGFQNEQIYIVRTDIDGTTLWTKTFGGIDDRDYGQSLIEVSDGNYLVAGHSRFEDVIYSQDVYLIKVDADGNELWSTTIQSPGQDFGYQVIETQDNGFAIAGMTEDSLTQQRDILIVKTDADGNEEWVRRYGQQLFDASYAITEADNGDFYLAGYMNLISPGDTSKQSVMLQVDENGQNPVIYELGATVPVSGAEIISADDGDFITALYNASSVYLKKISPAGAEDWSTLIPDFDLKLGNSLVQMEDGAYALVGSVTDTVIGQPDENLRIVRIDNSGTIEWDRTHGSPVGDDAALGVTPANGGGLGIVGYTRMGAGNRDVYLLHTDHLGNSLNNFVQGNIFYDLDEDCVFDNGEQGLNDWLIEINSVATTYYGLTDTEGNYRIAVPDGEFTLNLIHINDYWQSCENNIDIELSGPYDSLVVDIPVQGLYDCPLLEVDISTPFLRRCFDNQYRVTYRNVGPSSVDDVQVEVELDEYLDFLGASITPTVNGNVYLFDIDGVLEVGASGFFTIDVNVNCDDALLGQTHSVKAQITPDSICTPPEPCWEGGSIELSASCEGDSIRFKATNVGDSTIQEPLEYIIIEDHIILNVVGTLDSLPSGGDTTLVWPVEGATLRLEVDQVPCHPANSTPTVTVEGCGQVDPSEISLGYLTQYYEDDSNPFVSIDCQENIGSWDPNDKRGFPKGYKEPHYINVNQEMDYHIRFQNTGTDTAFRVVIRDTISKWLDVRDIQMGASSHDYTYEVYNNNILKVTFENIELPDSTTNEVASHGFVKYRIAQQLDNPLDTVIYNSAAIYFDYNEPVITEKTFHTLGEEYVEIFVSYDDIFVPGVYVEVFPNPFTSEATFEISYEAGISASDYDIKTFQLYDTMGRLVRSEKFEGDRYLFYREGLAPGLYFFNIETKNNLIFGGKLIAH